MGCLFVKVGEQVNIRRYFKIFRFGAKCCCMLIKKTERYRYRLSGGVMRVIH